LFAVVALIFTIGLPLAVGAVISRIAVTHVNDDPEFQITDSSQGVRQRSLLDCGPIALVMLMQQFREAPEPDQIERELPRSYVGTSIYALEKAASRRHFKANVLHGIAGPPPFILLHDHHFYVVLDRQGSRLDVLDPARGRGILTDRNTMSEYSLHISRG